MNVSTYVITLFRSAERVKHVEEILIPKLNNKLPTSFEKPQMFEAVDGSVPNLNTTLLKENEVELKHMNMLRGQIGCFLSHFTLWKKLLTIRTNDEEEQKRNVFIIFEDDANINDNIFWEKIQETLTETTKHDPLWKWIYLYEYDWQRNNQGGHERFKIDGCNAIEKACRSYGTGAYIISTEGAKYLVEHFTKSGLNTTIDDTIMGLVPIQRGFYYAYALNCVQIDGQLYKNEPNKKLKSNIW